MQIRRASSEDAEILLKFSNELFSELGHPFSGGILPLELLESGAYTALLALDDDGQVCGILSLNEGAAIYAGGRFGVIREFYVLEQQRSRGVGRSLLQAARQIAVSRGWKRLEVTPPHRDHWRRTYAFYMREGFVEIGPRLKLENIAQSTGCQAYTGDSDADQTSS